MAKRILLIAAAVLIVGLLYVGYTTFDAGRTGSNGDVYSTSGASNKTKQVTAVSDASPDTSGDTKPQTPETIVYPPATQRVSPTTPSGQTGQPGVSSGSATPPATDTISPMPPNGMVFSGTGHYQLYRQGNITWRLNTDTGQSCVLFATDDEWKKPRVLRAGCGKQ